MRFFRFFTFALLAVLTHSSPPPPAVKVDTSGKSPDFVIERLPEITDAVLQAKLDSIKATVYKDTVQDWSKLSSKDSARAADSVAKVRKAQREGRYVQRVEYDKSNFDHWRVDTNLQKRWKAKLNGDWRTPVVPHGFAFRDALLKFRMNDTLYSTTYTYSDSVRYHQTGEYSFAARFRFESDSTLRSREVFLDRNVVRWDYYTFRLRGDTLYYHLYKLEFRDINDNWLDVRQKFDHVAPEMYIRQAPGVKTPAPHRPGKPKLRS